MRPAPPTDDTRAAARSQLIKLLAARLVREALAERQAGAQQPPEEPHEQAEPDLHQWRRERIET